MQAFGEWRDLADLGTPYLRTCTNVRPGGNFYGPFPSLQTISDALGSTCVGACLVRDNTGGYQIFAGTATALYKYDGGSWDNVTRLAGGAYAVPSGEYWEFAQFGDLLIAVNIGDAPQKISISSGSNFAALGGTPPSARHVQVIGDYVVLSGLSGDLQTIQWSGTDDAESWTPGTDNGDIQTFPDGGDVGRVSGLESGSVLQKDAVRRMVYTPSSPLVFTFERIEDARGAAAPYATCRSGGTTFYYALDNFYALNGVSSVPIATDFVLAFFTRDADPASLYKMTAVADPRGPRVYWCYRSNDGSTAPFDKILGFDWVRNKWFLVLVDLEFAFAAATLGYTLEDMDAFGLLDTLDFSFDSAALQGGVPTIAGFSTTHAFGFFDGPALEATLETGEFFLGEPMRSVVTGVVPYVDTTAVATSVSGRSTYQADDSYTGESMPHSRTGTAYLRKNARFHRFKFRVPAGTSWTKAQGFDVEMHPDGEA